MPTTITWPLETEGVVDVGTGAGAGSLEASAVNSLPPLRARGTRPRAGLRIPLGVNPMGGAALVSSDEQDTKIIMTALSGCDNDNAFQQDQGLGEGMVFDINDPVTRGLIIRRLYQVFKDFERQKRYRLVPDTVQWQEGEGENAGDLFLTFMYLNLESDKPSTFQQRYGADHG